MFVQYTGSEEVLRALAEVGRTEDVQFSPDGNRLAIAGFSENRILILEIERMTAEPAWDIRFSKATMLKSASFNLPHGLAWADNEVLFVANRRGSVPAVRAPLFANSPELLVHPIQVIGSSEADFIETPGSVSLRALGPDLLEVLICNNFVHRVTRHLVNRQGFSILASETVLQSGLNVPDGVVVSHSGKWVAISNHYENCVCLYRADRAWPTDAPVGTLRGIGYPHGISFTPDDRALFVADAGAPSAHLFVATDGDWSGNRIPVSSIKVMDDETFERGHSNPEEGGPKGLTVSPDGNLICFTHEEQPLVFLDIREELARAGASPRGPAVAAEIEAGEIERQLARTMEKTRGALAASLRREMETKQRAGAAEARARAAESAGAAAAANAAAEANARAHSLAENAGVAQRNADTLEQQVSVLKRQLRAAKGKTLRAKTESTKAKARARNLLRSTSWRLTAPFRAIKRRLSPRK